MTPSEQTRFRYAYEWWGGRLGLVQFVLTGGAGFCFGSGWTAAAVIMGAAGLVVVGCRMKGSRK